MIKRALFVGLGITVIMVKKATSLMRAGGKMFTDRGQDADGMVAVATEQGPIGQNGQHVDAGAVGSAAPVSRVVKQTGKPDDLTAIKGIGPTYAKRLREAGINTYADLATQTPDQLAEITRATGAAADPLQWIAEARALDSFFSLE